MHDHPVKRLIRGGPKFLLLLTYREVFGGPRPTLDEFRVRLGTLPKIPLVRLCSVLNAFLRSDAESPDLLNLASHRALIKAYFPTEIAEKILPTAQGNQPRVVFHRQQMLFVAKEALQHGSEDQSLKMPNSALGELFLIANDLMHFEGDDGSTDTLDSFAKLATTVLPVQEAANGNVRHKILRSYQMTKAAPELASSKPYFDLFNLFKQATGLELMEYYAFVISAISRFHKFDPEKYLADPSIYSLDEHWFSSTRVSSEAIHAFFALMSATPQEFAGLLKPSRGPNDFTAFRERPLLRAFSKLDLIDLWMLAEKFESGPFWQINSILDGKQRDHFHSFWGRLFEKYIADLLRSSSDNRLNRVFISPVFDGTTEELSDAVIMCGRSAVLIESKGTTFTARAKYEGDYKLLRESLHKSTTRVIVE